MALWTLVGIIVAIFVLVFALAGSYNKFSGEMSEPGEESPRVHLGEDFTASDIEQIRFTPAIRGYRMDQVDAVIQQLQQRIADYEAEAAVDSETD